MDDNLYPNSYSFNVPPENRSKKKIISFLFLILLIMGIGAGVYLSQNRQAIKSRAQDSSNIEIDSPKRGEKVFGETIIKTKFNTQKQVRELHGVLKIDDANPQTMSLLRVDPESISLSSELNTRKFTQGLHRLEIYIYDLSSGKPVLIAKATSEINIEN